MAAGRSAVPGPGRHPFLSATPEATSDHTLLYRNIRPVQYGMPGAESAPGLLETCAGRSLWPPGPSAVSRLLHVFVKPSPLLPCGSCATSAPNKRCRQDVSPAAVTSAHHRTETVSRFMRRGALKPPAPAPGLLPAGSVGRGKCRDSFKELLQTAKMFIDCRNGPSVGARRPWVQRFVQLVTRSLGEVAGASVLLGRRRIQCETRVTWFPGGL